jgi:preprotein translocase subunit SecG
VGNVIRIILSIIFVIICVALSAIILLQEGKSQGLGSIGGMADTYWGRNKGRSMEGKLEKFTKYGAVLFFILALVLNLNIL